MQIKSLEVTNILLKRVDSKNKQISLQITFSDGTSLPLNMTLENNFELLVDKLMKQIKQIKKPTTNDDDFLGHISVVSIKNEEEIKEKAPARFHRVDKRIDLLKSTKEHKRYIDLFHQMSTFQDVIYEK